MKKRSSRSQAPKGFTLIELLVVVLIIGILAAMAIPQYFKVVERARMSEAKNMISVIRSAQERYLARVGDYTTTMSALDITFDNCTTTPASCGMKAYNLNSLGIETCTGDAPGYNVVVKRIGTVAARYKVSGAGYDVKYNRCDDQITYPSCPNCTSDFE
ncbi:MAG: prepilin-type N-terminal cleavage/methylation domain-containing protein [Elusimicrobia bacterium]|nr:prepilin-type N-terminal cleavage/methylation domain-containing protein [Elusimicrobiota bacterium]